MNKLLIFGVAAALVAGPATAQVIWDGNGNSNASGNWDTGTGTPGENWDTDTLPVSTDITTLPTVTDGTTRTVTQNIPLAGTTISSLAMLQDGLTGVNKLSLGGNLTLTAPSRNNATVDSTASAFRVTLTNGATVGQVVVDLNGFSMIFPTGSGAGGNPGGMNVGGTINFNASGSRMYTSSIGHTAINVFGALVATADARFGRDTGTS